MIEIRDISKSYDDGASKALSGISMRIDDGRVFGLIGTNGAGKSTLMRIMSGVIRPDSGNVWYDRRQFFRVSGRTGRVSGEDTALKTDICFLPDSWNFPLNATPAECAHRFQLFYQNFNEERFRKMMQTVGLDLSRPVRTFSRGMRKETSLLLGLCAGTRYLFCDEIFDGLDPVVRQAMKSLVAEEMVDRNFTPVIASHNLRELEDFCDHVGLLYKGGVLLSEELENMKLSIHKVQFVLRDKGREDELCRNLDVLQCRKRGSVMEILARGSADDIMQTVRSEDPVFAEILPVTLEEAFIGETEVNGYDFNSLFS